MRSRLTAASSLYHFLMDAVMAPSMAKKARTRLKPGRRFCKLGRISHEIGWKHKEVLDKLEAKRVEEGKVYHETKKALLAKQKAAAAKTASGPYAAVLAKFGY